MSRFTYLTPALFRELDTLARTFAGKPLVVERAEEMKGYFGYVSPMCTSVRIRLGERMCKDMVLITITNKIDLDAFAVNKVGVLDWSVIPVEDAFRFVLWHEIAHVTHLDPWLCFNTDLGAFSMKVRRGFWRLAEVRADRHAWDVLYPGKEMPLLPGAEEHLAEIAETAVTCKTILDKVKRRKPVEPLSTDPRDFVPVAHEAGIPWAPEVGADPLCPWGTVVEGRIVPAQYVTEKEACHA